VYQFTSSQDQIKMITKPFEIYRRIHISPAEMLCFFVIFVYEDYVLQRPAD